MGSHLLGHCTHPFQYLCPAGYPSVVVVVVVVVQGLLVLLVELGSDLLRYLLHRAECKRQAHHIKAAPLN